MCSVSHQGRSASWNEQCEYCVKNSNICLRMSSIHLFHAMRTNTEIPHTMQDPLPDRHIKLLHTPGSYKQQACQVARSKGPHYDDAGWK